MQSSQALYLEPLLKRTFSTIPSCTKNLKKIREGEFPAQIYLHFCMACAWHWSVIPSIFTGPLHCKTPKTTLEWGMGAGAHDWSWTVSYKHWKNGTALRHPRPANHQNCNLYRSFFLLPWSSIWLWLVVWSATYQTRANWKWVLFRLLFSFFLCSWGWFEVFVSGHPYPILAVYTATDQSWFCIGSLTVSAF